MLNFCEAQPLDSYAAQATIQAVEALTQAVRNDWTQSGNAKCKGSTLLSGLLGHNFASSLDNAYIAEDGHKTPYIDVFAFSSLTNRMEVKIVVTVLLIALLPGFLRYVQPQNNDCDCALGDGSTVVG